MSSRRFLDEVLRLDFSSFMHRTFQMVSPGDAFLANWHHDAIAWELRQIEEGANTRLIVNVPPRSLKSIMISTAWPAWLLGHNPRMRIVAASYSGSLSLKHARDCRRVLESSWYRRAFPGSQLSKRTAEHDFETARGGGRFSTSVDGTLTGRGGDLMIIDDPMNGTDAYSESARRKVVEFFSGTVMSRLNNKERGAIVLVMQRLHEEDLTGHLLDAGGWKHLCLPAIASEDQSIQIGPNSFYARNKGVPLQPARESLATLRQQKSEMGSMLFSAQYQQEPIPATGLMFQRRWLRSYEEPPRLTAGDRIVQSWDTATKDGVLNDYSVCITALVRKNQVFILDVFRAKLTFPALVEKTVRLARRYGAKVLLIEDAASGTELIQQLKRSSPSGVPTPIARKPTADKVTRASGQTARVEAGDLVLPEEAHWLAEFLKELLGFPNARFFDQVDALVHLLDWSGQRFDQAACIAGPIIISAEDPTGCGLYFDGDPWGS